ncbi:hypothetical protein IAE60_12875 [Pseudoxanthomonas mexicana]|jgi:hypothetical protein|uniref:Pyocin activator PrtN family protein n=1 Tax=Pseudoxanthomonas mexicana TaxID=128785 RepID=A0A7G9T9Q6_PSEMX|nr:hypothetical protein IAE60_12875 [Pseudoxanthomonas mexicana]
MCVAEPAASPLGPTPEALEDLLTRDLLRTYGPLIGQEELWRALGYSSLDAFRQAQLRGTVPVRVFAVENRRGKFALAQDVANWLAHQYRRSGGDRLFTFSSTQ